MQPLIDKYSFPKRLGEGGINLTIECGNSTNCSPLSDDLWFLKFAETPPQMSQPFRDIYDYTLKVLGKIDSSNHSLKCVEFEFFGPAHNFYYFFKFLIWADGVERERLKLYGIDFGESKNYLLQVMSRFVKEVVDSQDEEIFYPQKINTCSVEGCNQSLPKQIQIVTSDGLDVIVPTRNVSFSEIQRCLESICGDLRDFDKVILIDDNPEPLIELEKLRLDHPRLEIYRGSKKGVAAARNLGLLHSKNDLVAFVDSDDFVRPGFLQVQRRFHQKNLNVAATGTWLRAFGSHSRLYSQWDNFGVLNSLMCLPPAGVLMWKKSVLNELNGFEEEFGKGFEDFHLVARASCNNHVIAILDSPLYFYQRGHGSLSQSWTLEEEGNLRSKVNSSITNLCEHQVQEIFKLFAKYGSLLLLSHPDLVFEVNKNWMSIFLGKVLMPRKYRNKQFVRVIWHLVPRILRRRIFKFAMKVSQGY